MISLLTGPLCWGSVGRRETRSWGLNWPFADDMQMFPESSVSELERKIV